MQSNLHSFFNVFFNYGGFRMNNKTISSNKDFLRANIFKNYIYVFLSNFNLTGGIWMLYLASKGLNLLEIGIMESIYHITSFTMEIPTGIVADLYGRKSSRILGRLANIISIILMLISNEIYVFALSFIFTAIGNNLESGAGEALLYDSLKELKEQDTYMKIAGKNEIFYQVASSLALILGGFLGTINYMYVYIVALVFSILTLLQSLTFTEPTIGKINASASRFNIFINQFNTSITIIKNDFRITFFILSIEIFSTFVTTEFFYIQNYFKSLGRSEFEIGILLSISAFTAAILATTAHKLENKYGFTGILTILPILAIISFWGITNSSLIEIAFISIISIDSILVVVISDYINRLIPSEQRATILSFQSMSFSFFMILLFPLIGRIGDIFGLNYAFNIIALISSFVLLIFIFMIQKNSKLNINKN